METIKLELTIEDINRILSALGERPFIEMHELIANIQEQARLQIEHMNEQQGKDSE